MTWTKFDHQQFDFWVFTIFNNSQPRKNVKTRDEEILSWFVDHKFAAINKTMSTLQSRFSFRSILLHIREGRARSPCKHKRCVIRKGIASHRSILMTHENSTVDSFNVHPLCLSCNYENIFCSRFQWNLWKLKMQRCVLGVDEGWQNWKGDFEAFMIQPTTENGQQNWFFVVVFALIHYARIIHTSCRLIRCRQL